MAAAFAVVLVAAAVWVLWMFHTAKGQAAMSRLLWAPGPIGRWTAAASPRLWRSCSPSGLPLDEAMDRSCDLLDGTGIAPSLKECRTRTAAGTAFADAVEGCGLFTGLQAGLLSAGFRPAYPSRLWRRSPAAARPTPMSGCPFCSAALNMPWVIILCLAVGLVLLSVMLPLLGVLSAIGG